MRLSVFLALLAFAAGTGAAADDAAEAAADEAPAAGTDAEAAAEQEEAHEVTGNLGGLAVEGGSEWWIPTQRDLGLEWSSADGRFTVNPWLRAQLRYFDPFDGDRLRVADFDEEGESEFEFRRARLKMEGELGSPNVTYYYEHEITGDHPLLDLRVDLSWRGSLHARIGQYKVLYNRERIDSSGKQTFAERSIATYAFTLDRQRGIGLAKQWGAGTRANQWLMLGVYEGDSRDPERRGDGLMYVARWQWAFLGPDLPFSQGDLKFRDTPAATLAFATATVEGPYTRFSSSGGGQLDGYETGDDDRYRLTQFLQEFAWHYRGYEIQQEYHMKRVDDREQGTEGTLRGGYAQFGKLWNAPFGRWGLPAGLALRFAQVDWDDTPVDRTERELSLVGNVFFDGHNNKLTSEVSRVEVSEPGLGNADDVRWRLQWDVSF